MTATPQRSEVLVVGAGPTGLVLALWLKRLGIGVRIIDKAAESGTSSRALVVHARTLEFYRQLGIATDVVERGLPFAAINLWVRGRHRARAAFGEIGRGLSPGPSDAGAACDTQCQQAYSPCTATCAFDGGLDSCLSCFYDCAQAAEQCFNACPP